MNNKYEETAMLTTFDNPYNPFEDYTSWMLFDIQKGYGTADYLARIIAQKGGYNDALSEEESNSIISDSIDEIIFNDALGIYKKIWPGQKD